MERMYRGEQGLPDRRIFTVLVAVVCAAHGCACNDDTLIDISCKPGDPASGRFDPDLEERCDNLIDDNCDGSVNEGCECVDGDTFTCGSDVGVCTTRTVTCVGGRFPDCVPSRTPSPERCDGIDNDCDGAVDEDVGPEECWTGPPSTPHDGSTGCHSGVRRCIGGGWTLCEGQVLPSEEVCDGIDNDCDGEIDDDPVTDGRSCGPAVEQGQCIQGRERCHGGESLCIGATFAQNEVCDGIDNDCDGARDEDLYRPCQTVCGAGTESCAGGRWVSCTAPMPMVEICDGVDNDCDGEVDEGCPCLSGSVQPCIEDMVDSDGDPVTCGYGLQVCVQATWGDCVFFGTTAEFCNAWDDDCDGQVDGFTVQCGDPYTAGTGECRLGTSECTDGEWGECLGTVVPEEEICDGLDNDCDSETDEDLDPHNKVDMVFLIDISGSMCPYISALAQGISTYVSDFSGTDHRFALAVFPGWGSNIVLTLNPDLTDAASFLAALSSIGCNGGGSEPVYDALLALTSPSNTYGVSWRQDAFPYVVVVTDEPAQTWYWVSENQVAGQTSNCTLPGCQSGDRVEVFIITNLNYQMSYDQIVYGEMDRLIEIEPPSADRYTGILRSIFTNVCIGTN